MCVYVLPSHVYEGTDWLSVSRDEDALQIDESEEDPMSLSLDSPSPETPAANVCLYEGMPINATVTKSLSKKRVRIQ